AHRNRDIDMDFMPIAGDAIRPVETRCDLAGTSFGMVLRTGQNRDKFITAPAADKIPCAHLAAETGRQLLQDLVPAQMPMLIVDLLESVEIEQQHAKFLLRLNAGGEFAIQLPAIGDPRERI